MSVAIPAGVADYLQRTSGFLNPAANSTVMFWVNFGTVPASPAYNLAYALLDNPAVYTDFVTIDAIDNAAAFLEVAFPGAVNAQTSTVPTASTWYHVAWVQFGTSQALFVNGVLVDTATKNRAAFTIGFEMLGNDTFATGNCKIAYFRSWQTDLTAAQVLSEMGATQAALSTSLFMDTPLVSDLLDDSGNGHNWSQVGTVPFSADEPDLPANNTAFTATALTTSDSFTVDMGQGTTAWFSYTPSSVNEVVLGFWALYEYAKVTQMLISVYSGSPSALTLWPNTTNGIDGSTSVPYQIPVTAGVTVYIKIYMHLGSQLPFTSDIAISTLPGPAEDIAIGSIAVNDDLDGFPLAMMNNATGEPSDFLRFPASGSGVVMPVTGEVMLDTGAANLGATEFRIYQSDYQTFTSVPYPTNTLPAGPFVMGTDGTSLFYAVSDNASIRYHIITAYDLTGALIATYDVGLFSIRAGSPNADNTIFYYTTAGPGAVIKRWDLVNDVALADLPGTGIALYAPGPDLLVLGDNTLIAYYHRNGFADQIKHYDATGATLNTYTMAASPISIDHIATAIDDPNSFWAWLHNGTSAIFASTFLNIKVSDGSFLTDVDAQQFEQGQYGGDFTTAPNARFGHSNSCPFWIVRVGITPPTPGPGEPEEFIIRRERWFPVLNQENQRMTYSMLQVDLQAGNGLTTGQGSEPLLELDWSDDAGWTWSNIRFLPTGRIGQYNRRAIARVLGQSRQRVFRIAVSDPVQWVILDGYMQVKGGTS